MKTLFSFVGVILLSLSTYAQHKLGDILNVNGSLGMVVVVDEAGEHGLLISLEDSKADWTNDNALNMETNAFYEDDGAKNMKAIATYIEDNGKQWSDFPVFDWARSLGSDWYIPSRDELVQIFTNLNGGDLKINKKSKKSWKKYNKIIKKAGGEDFYTTNIASMGVGKMLAGLISSTESSGGKICAVGPIGRRIAMNALVHPSGTIEASEIEKNNHSVTKDALSVTYSFRTRAVCKF